MQQASRDKDLSGPSEGGGGVSLNRDRKGIGREMAAFPPKEKELGVKKKGGRGGPALQ